MAAPFADAAGLGSAGRVYGWTGPIPSHGVITASAQTADLVVYGPSADGGKGGITLRMADTDGDGDDDLHIGFPDVAALDRRSVGAVYIVHGPLLEPAPTVTPRPSPGPTGTDTAEPSATLQASATPETSPSATASPSPSATSEPSPSLQPTSSARATEPPTAAPTSLPGAAWLPLLLLRR